MPKVNLTRASWEVAVELIRAQAGIDWPREPNPFLTYLADDIESQIIGQEG